MAVLRDEVSTLVSVPSAIFLLMLSLKGIPQISCGGILVLNFVSVPMLLQTPMSAMSVLSAVLFGEGLVLILREVVFLLASLFLKPRLVSA